MSAVERLALRIKRPLRAVPKDDWKKLRSEAAAVKYAVEHCGLLDKSVALETDIDPAILSKAKSGQARLNETDMDALMDATGSEAPLYAMLLRRGYDPASLRRIETDLERENRELRERLAQREMEHEMEMRGARKLIAQGLAA